MEGVERNLLEKMPLAEAVWIVWRRIADAERLQAVYDANRGRCYDLVLTFPELVQLTADALLQHGGSGNQAFTRARENGTLPVSERAVYGKLSRLPLAVSVAWFQTSTQELMQLAPQNATRPLPTSLEEFSAMVVDGKTVKHLQHRLKALRSVTGGVTGGKALAALEYGSGMAVAFAADLDGNANDVKLIPQLLPMVRKFSKKRLLWVADRQFCDLIQLSRFAEGKDAFVVRYNAKVTFAPDPERSPRRSIDAQSRPLLEEWGWLGREGHAQRRYVRRITVVRNDGDDVAIVTDLLESDVHPACDLSAMYLARWGIERVFQQVTEVFHLRHLIGGTPEATIFQFAFCLLLYNIMQLIRMWVAEPQRRDREDISTEQLFRDAGRQLTAWTVIYGVEITQRLIPPRRTEEARRRLKDLLSRTWSDRWKKAVNRKPRPHRNQPTTRDNTSVHRALTAAKSGS
jgi:hypothetical protein